MMRAVLYLVLGSAVLLSGAALLHRLRRGHTLRARSWLVERRCRDSFIYKERVGGRLEQIEIGGEMLVGTPHHVIYIPNDTEWDRRYPRRAQGRRRGIAVRIASELRPPEYDYDYAV